MAGSWHFSQFCLNGMFRLSKKVVSAAGAVKTSHSMVASVTSKASSNFLAHLRICKCLTLSLCPSLYKCLSFLSLSCSSSFLCPWRSKGTVLVQELLTVLVAAQARTTRAQRRTHCVSYGDNGPATKSVSRSMNPENHKWVGTLVDRKNRLLVSMVLGSPH